MNLLSCLVVSDVETVRYSFLIVSHAHYIDLPNQSAGLKVLNFTRVRQCFSFPCTVCGSLCVVV